MEAVGIKKLIENTRGVLVDGKTDGSCYKIIVETLEI